MTRLAPALVLCIAAVVAWGSALQPEATLQAAAQQKKSDQKKSAKTKPSQEKDKPGDEKKKPKWLADFMRQKLEASNQVLEGLVTDDLKMISEGSDKLMKISTAERWRIINDPTYGRFSREYRGTITKLKEKAKKGNLDGAALAWMDVTMSCIECHEWVRNVVIADGSDIRIPAQ